MGTRIIRRIILICRLIYKPLFLVAGYALYAASVISDNRIFAELPENGNAFALIWHYMRQLPVKEVLSSYIGAMLTFSQSGMAGTINLFMAIPFIPLIFAAMFKGMGKYAEYCSQCVFKVTYIYTDGSRKTVTEVPGFWMLIGGLLIRFLLAGVVYLASPIILIVSWFFNLAQFLCPPPKTAAAA